MVIVSPVGPRRRILSAVLTDNSRRFARAPTGAFSSEIKGQTTLSSTERPPSKTQTNAYEGRLAGPSRSWIDNEIDYSSKPDEFRSVAIARVGILGVVHTCGAYPVGWAPSN